MIVLALFILLLPVAAKTQEQRPAASPQLTRGEIEEFLLKGSIVSQRPRSEYQSRITLEDSKRRHDASVETEDGTTPTQRNYRFNLAAYELDKTLELDLVPVTVVRTVNGRPASVTWWVDDVAMTEMTRRRKKIEPPDPQSWDKQMQAVRVFDELMSNRYRNMNPERFERPDGTVTPFDASWVELVITQDWRIWLIDHTETFRVRKQLEHPQSLIRCDRRLLRKLQELNKKVFELKLAKYLSPEELDALETRRALLVKHFQEQISRKSEGDVLYDLPPRR